MKQKKILLVDDEEPLRSMLRKVLETDDYDVTEAVNGVEAQRLLKKGPFDLLITDVIMPECDGIELLTAIQGRYPAMKVLVMSGGGEVWPGYYLDKARKLGAVNVVEKPFKTQTLRGTVANLLKGEDRG